MSNNHTLYISGGWSNWPDGFVEGTGRVVFYGSEAQLCQINVEQFYILEIDKPINSFFITAGRSVSCQIYDWTHGGMQIYGGSSFHAADLADNGIYGIYYIADVATVELHQDKGQGIDLIANNHISGGEFKVYGGNQKSFWGSTGNANLNMSGGVIDFIDQGISIQDASPCSFTSTISGGSIRSQNMVAAQSPGFNPSGGTVELYGAPNSLIVAENGATFYDLKISKAPLPTTAILLSSTIKNSLLIVEGTTVVQFGCTINCNNITIENGGDFRIASATLKMKNGAAMNVNNGGYFYSEGYEGAKSKITGINLSDRYSFQVNAGGTIFPNYTIFENMNSQGILIAPSAIVFEWQQFKNCEFRNGAAGASPLLSKNNSQNMLIENAVFPANTWGGQYNVRKNVNTGSVTFANATGAFAGSAYEDDLYNCIHWTTGLPPHLLTLNLLLEGLYNGTGLNKAQNATGNQFSGDIADVISVELHNTTAPYDLIGGPYSVNLNTGGSSLVSIDGTLSSSYFIAVKHRNSIETWSAAPVSFASGTIGYSFNAPAKAFGGNVSQMPSGQYVIYGGDVNQDGSVNQSDKEDEYISAKTFLSGYIAVDANGDGILDAADMIITDNNASKFVVKLHP